MMRATFLGSLVVVLTSCGIQQVSTMDSLTGSDFTGKKYYFGWGAAEVFDPENMHNEVKYDVQHTHDIFTKQIGGDYLGTTQVGARIVSGTSIKKRWDLYKQQIETQDMYVQYSGGHGSPSGLGVGVTYKEIRDAALGFGARETIIFTMACQSGYLVNKFNEQRAEWENFAREGRSLLVFTSSKAGQDSDLGPGTDTDEPNGPEGSAGSAFGHALWKALIGYADGFTDGVKDGFLSLDEILDFTVWKTKEVGGHTPVYTGVFNPNLVMNRIPERSYLESLNDSTEGLSDETVRDLIRENDRNCGC